MIKYIFRRFLELLLALFLIATATFFLTAAAPGDPLVSRTMSLPQASRDAMYAKYGLDKPLMQRYVITMKGMLHGDFGESVVYEGQTLQDIIREKLPVSARLGPPVPDFRRAGWTIFGRDRGGEARHVDRPGDRRVCGAC